jgi:hypothetical protein
MSGVDTRLSDDYDTGRNTLQPSVIRVVVACVFLFSTNEQDDE